MKRKPTDSIAFKKNIFKTSRQYRIGTAFIFSMHRKKKDAQIAGIPYITFEQILAQNCFYFIRSFLKLNGGLYGKT